MVTHGTALPPVNASITALAADVTALLAPPLAALSINVAEVPPLLAAIPTAALRAALVALAQLLQPAAMPDFASTLAEIDKVNTGGSRVLGCVAGLLAQAAALNASLLRLPSAFDGAVGSFASVNASFLALAPTASAQHATLAGLRGSLAGWRSWRVALPWPCWRRRWRPACCRWRACGWRRAHS